MEDDEYKETLAQILKNRSTCTDMSIYNYDDIYDSYKLMPIFPKKKSPPKPKPMIISHQSKLIDESFVDFSYYYNMVTYDGSLSDEEISDLCSGLYSYFSYGYNCVIAFEKAGDMAKFIMKYGADDLGISRYFELDIENDKIPREVIINMHRNNLIISNLSSDCVTSLLSTTKGFYCITDNGILFEHEDDMVRFKAYRFDKSENGVISRF